MQPKGPSSARNRFLLRRLHSLSGVVPLGLFLCEHLWTNAGVLAGRANFDHAVGELQKLPALPLFEIFGILLPLVFHAGYGMVLAREAKPNVGSYGYVRNWLYVMQRVSGVVVFAFVAAHLWEFRVQKWLFGMTPTNFYDSMEAHLSSTRWGIPWIAVGYLVGVAATAFHFANGLWGFAVSWGIVVSRRAMLRLGWASAFVGSALFALGALTVVSMATGSRFGLNTPAPAPALSNCKAPNPSPPH